MGPSNLKNTKQTDLGRILHLHDLANHHDCCDYNDAHQPNSHNMLLHLGTDSSGRSGTWHRLIWMVRQNRKDPFATRRRHIRKVRHMAQTHPEGQAKAQLVYARCLYTFSYFFTPKHVRSKSNYGGSSLRQPEKTIPYTDASLYIAIALAMACLFASIRAL